MRRPLQRLLLAAMLALVAMWLTEDRASAVYWCDLCSENSSCSQSCCSADNEEWTTCLVYGLSRFQEEVRQ